MESIKNWVIHFYILLQLALEEIMMKMFLLFQETLVSVMKKKLIQHQRIKSQGINIIIGPISNKDFEEVKKYNDIIFISPSNINPEF